jgi:peptide-methionine (S)-S-oxide reductase
MENGTQREKATFAAGCFWGVEAAFMRIEGVIETAVGFTGGSIPEPTYEKGCSGITGHAEAVEMIFDPAMVTYEALLGIFWSIHDPTQLNRQGLDVGTNYRSAIFYHTPNQKKIAEASRDRLQASAKYQGRSIVTEIVPGSAFWKAEEYHQQFYEKCGRGYSVSPKCWE